MAILHLHPLCTQTPHPRSRPDSTAIPPPHPYLPTSPGLPFSCFPDPLPPVLLPARTPRRDPAPPAPNPPAEPKKGRGRRSVPSPGPRSSGSLSGREIPKRRAHPHVLSDGADATGSAELIRCRPPQHPAPEQVLVKHIERAPEVIPDVLSTPECQEPDGSSVARTSSEDLRLSRGTVETE